MFTISAAIPRPLPSSLEIKNQFQSYKRTWPISNDSLTSYFRSQIKTTTFSNRKRRSNDWSFLRKIPSWISQNHFGNRCIDLSSQLRSWCRDWSHMRLAEWQIRSFSRDFRTRTDDTTKSSKKRSFREDLRWNQIRNGQLLTHRVNRKRYRKSIG